MKLVVNQAKPVIAWAPPTSVTTGTALSAIQLNAKASVPGTFTYSPPLGTVLLTGTRPLTAAFVPSDAVDYMPVTANAAIAVQAEPSKIAPKVTWNTPSAVRYGTALSSTQLDATANAPGTFTYVPAAGTVLKAGTQLLSVSFTPTNTVAFSKTNASVLITVTKATPVITWAPLRNIPQGTPLGVAQLNAMANVLGTFSYSPGPGSVLPVGTRRLAATFSPNDAVDYTPVTVNNPLTIVTASEAATTPAITWKAPAAITYGTALGSTQLDATANVSGSFAYTPPAGTVLTRGRRTLTAVFTPSDTKAYTTAAASVQLTVNPVVPLITWATPNPITAGTVLSAAQLNARASVPGSFTYSPAAGAVLAAGTHQLTVAFSPADINDYSSVTAQTSLVVDSTSGPIGPGTNCALTPGASISTIQGAINAGSNDSCAVQTVDGISLDGHTVLFTPGNYTISSRLSIPCPTTAMTITGPTPSGAPNSWPITPTAILTSTLTNNWALSGTACSKGTTIQYLQYNGGQPSGGGGGFLYVPSGMNNLSVLWNWFHGNSALQTTQQGADAFIWLDGSTSSSRTQNTTIQWNRFGQLGSNDCAQLMDLFGGGGGAGTCSPNGYAPPTGTSSCLYQGGSNLNSAGGSCAAVGVHSLTDNLVISNNSVQTQEQGFKFFENVTTDSNGSTNSTVCNNDLAGIHRIGLETQTNNSNIVVCNNDFHDPIKPNAGQWALSLPQNNVNSTNNVLIANTAISNDRNGNPASYAGAAIEFWGSGISSNNLIQGGWVGGVNWGFTPGGWSANYNIIQMTPYRCYICNEEGGSTPPSQTGNVTGSTTSAITSVAPTFSPAAGSVTFPLTVTLTDPGSTSGAGPKGNTGIWYTTDNSSPVPGSGSAKYLSSGQTITLNSAVTVKAVGMWGSLNQPTSYPSGYGFVPSAVVTASYTTPSIAKPAAAARVSSSGGQAATAPAAAIHFPAQSGLVAPALESVAIDPSQPVVAIGSTTQLKAIATFNDGSAKDVTADFAWESSDTRTIAANLVWRGFRAG